MKNHHEMLSTEIIEARALTTEKHKEFTALKLALQAIINRHEVLRTVFTQNEQGIYHQEIKNEPLYIIEKIINQNTFSQERQAFLQKPFDLKNEYPIRACLFNII